MRVTGGIAAEVTRQAQPEPASEAGSKLPAVLLLHGQPGGAEDWGAVEQALAGHARTMAIDRPGWDGRHPPGGLAENAAAALGALDAAGVGSATVVGHSFGGAVACWLAVEHPERVERLVLAAPAANVASLYRLDRWLALPVVGELVTATVMGTTGAALATPPLRSRLSRLLSVENRYLRESGRRLMRPGAWQAFCTEQRVLVRELPQLERRLDEIRAATTILAGARDWVVPLEALRQLTRQIPTAELVLVPGADHMLPLRDAGRFAEVVLSDFPAAG